MKIKILFLLAGAVVLLEGCQPKNFEAQQLMAENASRGLGCDSAKSLFFDSMYAYVDRHGAWSESEFQKLVRESIEQNHSYLSELQRKLLFQQVAKMFQFFGREIQSQPDALAMVRRLIEMEMQDVGTAEAAKSNQKLDAQWRQLQSLTKALNLECQPPVEAAPVESDPGDQGAPGDTPIETPIDTPADAPVDSPSDKPTEGPVGNLKTSMGLAIEKSFATAYQSCEVLSMPPMDRLVSSVRGIRVLPDAHPGGGLRREIASLSEVNQSHHYIRNFRSRQGCFDVKASPLIYDFGGQPAVERDRLSFFRDSGSGTSVLGVDCSALVSTILGVGGRRYTESLENKPIYVRQSSTKFLRPESSGFTCFSRVKIDAQKSISRGDIIAVSGHVVMVDEVMPDPFGLARINNITQCERVKAEDFEFSVVQSSPSKGGIGMNRFWVKDYASESSKMRNAFERIGYYACVAKMKGQEIIPSESSYSLIRHKGNAACSSSNISLVGESCVASCTAQANLPPE